MFVRRIVISFAFFLFAIASAGPAGAADDALGLIASASVADGQKIFLRCKACHTIDQGGRNMLGPNLWGVVGRPKASVPGFNYSPALKKLGGEWDYSALLAYLESPRAFAPGNRMAFPGLPNPRQRAAVIAYLRTQAANPLPLPQAEAAHVASGAPETTEPETYGGLPPGEGREETFAICDSCHSLKLVTQQGLSSERWDELMDWMTDQRGMPELEPEMRQRIVGYLAQNFGPESRRGGTMSPMSPMAPMMPMMPAMPNP